MKKINVLDLRPTQFVFGVREIEAKLKKMKNFKGSELQDYIDDHVIPVVQGPKNELYLIDHHHFARACWEQGVQDFKIKIIKDLSHLDLPTFWNFMIQEEWVYLHDQFGMGPHSPFSLPSDIRCLADDPYRSLVWELIDAGHIKKDKVPFFEFQWAAYFRFNLDLKLHSKSNFKVAIEKAKKLCHSKAAVGLPGFIRSK